MLRSALACSLSILCSAVGLSAQGDPMPALEAGFREPPADTKPMVLWPWLNGFVDRDRAAYELREMKDKGIRGPIIWDIGSLADRDKIIPAGPEFLGEESLDTIRFVFDEAERLGLEVGLVASSSWNAGGAWIDPEHASKQLLWGEQKVTGPMRFEGPLPEPDKLTEPFTEVATFLVGTKEPAFAIELIGKVGEDGILRVDVPEGDWVIQRFVCCGTGQPLVCPSPNSNGLVVDHMSIGATDRHFEVMLERLMPGGKRPPALKWLMLDSFEVWPRVDWTPGFADRFTIEFGYSMRPWLPVLAGKSLGKPELEQRFLHDYRELVSKLMTNDHFGRAAQLVGAAGLELISEAGHGGYPRVDALQALGTAHLPMGEFWNGKQFWVTKEAASAAHIYGRRDVLAEALTGWRHWRDGPAEYKRLMDLAFCAGLTRPVFHTFAHNPEIAGKPGFAYHAGEHFNVNSTWWQQSGPMLKYLARCGLMLRQGTFVADVAFYYGDDAPSLVPPPCIDPKVEPPHDPDECQHCGRKMPNRTDRLGPGYDFDYVNADIVVRDMKVVDGKLRLSSGMEYRALVLPEREDLDEKVLRKVEQLVAGGATVFGIPPTRATGMAFYPNGDAEVRKMAGRLWGGDAPRVLAPTELRAKLKELGADLDVDVHLPDGHPIRWIHRRTADAEIYFLTNISDEAQAFECSFRVPADMRPSLWDPMDGSTTPCLSFRAEGDHIRVPIELSEVGSVFVVFERGPGGDHVTDVRETGARRSGLMIPGVEVLDIRENELRVLVRNPVDVEISTSAGRQARLRASGISGPIEFGDGFELRFPPGSGVSEEPWSGDLQSWTEIGLEGARYFAGTATYSKTWKMSGAELGEGVRWELDLGSVADVAEVSVNGQLLPTLWKPPYRADVTDLLEAGENRLEIRVTNTWHNRIVGDLRSPSAEPRARTNMKVRFNKDMELLPAGLLGPVQLVPAIETTVLR